tara:strand:- start:334 stop:960 length:627 start_codon:yes stop_codon:yes gene_type:complete
MTDKKNSLIFGQQLENPLYFFMKNYSLIKMGFFQTIKTGRIGNKIATKTAKCAGEMVNHLILGGHHVKTHDTLNITFSFFNYYMTTGLALHNDKANDFRLSIIHFAREDIIQWLKKVIPTDAMGKAGIENIFYESGEYDENFNAYLRLHKEKISEYEKENNHDPELPLKKTTAEHLINYLNTVFELNESQKNELKDFAIQKLKFNVLY